ncbi:ACH96247.1 GrBNV gp34-like protein [Kallithea virus]|uniref:ACH96247.1 GrBNV gp34-like protein n=1 Tax=Kallithea virus TaxID=1654582 RepID=A0A1S5VG67_9VIRU|nr:ACH96247.1 GrBNV gp34-like protein [Kallithea virus]AQN78626.1 ACH96247.1 GrBNV gp34-like protein [Kallithea virus]
MLINSIMNFNIPMPKCNYSIESRRRICKKAHKRKHNTEFIRQQHRIDECDRERPSIQEQLQQLDGWDQFSEIAIDGQNGTTKSSLAKSLNRVYLKINELFPKISCGSDYNHRPVKSLDYILFHLMVKSSNSIWDRCMYSNLIFYYVHHLMFIFANSSIPNDETIIWPILNNMALDTGLLETLDLAQSIRNVPTLFLVCSNIDLIGESLRNRGIKTNSLNDIWNSKEYNYQMAQYHVYRWFGKIMKYPVFDIVDFFKEGMIVDDIRILIASKIDIPNNQSCKNNIGQCTCPVKGVDNNSQDNPHCTNIPDQTKYDKFDNIIESNNDDVLVYEYSRK